MWLSAEAEEIEMLPIAMWGMNGCAWSIVRYLRLGYYDAINESGPEVLRGSGRLSQPSLQAHRYAALNHVI